MYAAAYSHMHVLTWAHANACPWGVNVCAAAAAGCKWYCSTEAAPAGGRLSVLVWLHENSCPWDQYTTKAAAAAGN